jgi:hypothetical protein
MVGPSVREMKCEANPGRFTEIAFVALTAEHFLPESDCAHRGCASRARRVQFSSFISIVVMPGDSVDKAVKNAGLCSLLLDDISIKRLYARLCSFPATATSTYSPAFAGKRTRCLCRTGQPDAGI